VRRIFAAVVLVDAEKRGHVRRERCGEYERESPAPVVEIGLMNMQELGARRDVSGSYKVHVTRGEQIGRVSSEWFSRSDDERKRCGANANRFQMYTMRNAGPLDDQIKAENAAGLTAMETFGKDGQSLGFLPQPFNVRAHGRATVLPASSPPADA
jgi:hypothetical protein